MDASALPEEYPRLVWTEGDGRIVGVYGQEGGCSRVSAEVREQSATTVRIELIENIPSTGPCTMDLRFPAKHVKLDAPLGERKVVLHETTIGPPK